MLKTKLFSFVVACAIGVMSISPVSVLASETKSESVTLSETSKGQKDKSSAFEDSMKTANEKWNTLTDKQKAEVFALLEDEMKAEYKLIDKLVEFGVLQKEDVSMIKTRMQQKLDELKKSGSFPLSRPKRERKQK